MKNFEISVLTANSRYLQTAALKYIACNSRKGDRARWSLVRDRGKQHKKNVKIWQNFYEQYYSILKKCRKRGLIISDISDQLPIFSIVFGDYLRKDSNSFTIQDTSKIKINEFRPKLENTNWDFPDQANNANDPNTAYNIFIDKYTGLFDTCFPFKTIKGKALNFFTKPWLTKTLLKKSINKKNKLYKHNLRSGPILAVLIHSL